MNRRGPGEVAGGGIVASGIKHSGFEPSTAIISHTTDLLHLAIEWGQVTSLRENVTRYLAHTEHREKCWLSGLLKVVCG